MPENMDLSPSSPPSVTRKPLSFQAPWISLWITLCEPEGQRKNDTLAFTMRSDNTSIGKE
jgi:hypothetical protein